MDRLETYEGVGVMWWQKTATRKEKTCWNTEMCLEYSEKQGSFGWYTLRARWKTGRTEGRRAMGCVRWRLLGHCKDSGFNSEWNQEPSRVLSKGEHGKIWLTILDHFRLLVVNKLQKRKDKAERLDRRLLLLLTSLIERCYWLGWWRCWVSRCWL